MKRGPTISIAPVYRHIRVGLAELLCLSADLQIVEARIGGLRANGLNGLDALYTAIANELERVGMEAGDA